MTLPVPKARSSLVVRVAVVAIVIVVTASIGIAALLHRRGASSDQASAPVDPQRGGSVVLGDAMLSAPAGAVSTQGTLTASTASPPPVSGDATSGLIPVGHSGPVLFQVADASITGPLEISFKVGVVTLPAALTAADAEAAVWIAFYDTTTQTWTPVRSTYNSATGTVSAEVDHLSWWAPWTWDWQGAALRLRQLLSGFGSGRAPGVTCPTMAQVTVTSDGGQDPPLIGCAAPRNRDSLTVSLTNNRGLSVVVTNVPSGAVQGQPSYDGFGAWLDTRNNVAEALGGTVIPPSQTLTYTMPLNGPRAVFIAAPSVKSYALDLAVMIGEALLDVTKFTTKTIEVSGAYLTCVLNLVARSEPASFEDAASLVESCVPELATAVPALKGLGGVTLKLIIGDLRLIVQDFDLAYDLRRHQIGHRQGQHHPPPADHIDPCPTTAEFQPATRTCGAEQSDPYPAVRNSRADHMERQFRQ
jgi:hypothetical protein